MDFITRHGTQSKLYNLRLEILSDQYVLWQSTTVHSELTDKIYKVYLDANLNPLLADSWIRFETKGLSAAISISSVIEKFQVTDLINYQMLISEKLKTHGYIVNLSEVKQHSENEHSLIIYQKPSFKLPLINDKSDQIYGNIHSEIRIKSGELVFFKIIVHRYKDYRFDDGKTFDDLITALFKN
jgi:hypothetical protein